MRLLTDNEFEAIKKLVKLLNAPNDREDLDFIGLLLEHTALSADEVAKLSKKFTTDENEYSCDKAFCCGFIIDEYMFSDEVEHCRHWYQKQMKPIIVVETEEFSADTKKWFRMAGRFQRIDVVGKDGKVHLSFGG